MEELFKYLKGFYEKKSIPFSCPNCKKNSLFLKENSWFEHDNSEKYYSEEWYDAEFNGQIIYTAIFECVNSQCLSNVISSGIGKVESVQELDEDGYPTSSGKYITKYIPQYFNPPVNFFDVPENISNEVNCALISAFKLLPQSPSAAANRTRSAVERILDDFDIEPHTNLNTRLEKYVPNSDRLKNYTDNFHALRILGNSGSHEEDAIKLKDMNDAFEIIQDLLKHLYSEEKATLTQKVRAIKDANRPLSYKQRMELNKLIARMEKQKS